MRVLEAISNVGGPSQPGDIHLARDGDLVVPAVSECASAACDRCERAWISLSCGSGTTSAVVVERPDLTPAALRELVHDWLDDAGWIDLVVQAADSGEYRIDGRVVGDAVWEVEEAVAEQVALVARICAAYPVGSVLSRLGDLVAERVGPRAA